MVTKYVWWDEKQKLERVRTEVNFPRPLREFLDEVAQLHGVSVSALVCGIVAFASESSEGKRLRIEVVPGVRVTDEKPGSGPVDVPVPSASPGYRKRWEKSNVL